MILNSRVLFLSILLSLLVSSLISPSNLSANNVTFVDDFNDNDISDWTVAKNNCKFNGNQAQWVSILGELTFTVNGGNCSSYIFPPMLLPDSGNYSISVSMRVSDINQDRNIMIKFYDTDNWYDLHIVGNEVYFEKVVNGIEYILPGRLVSYPFQNNGTYIFTINVTQNKFEIFVNGSLINTIADSSPTFDGMYSGLAASAGGIPFSEVWFDNFVLSEIDVSPAITIPDIKQTDPLWKDEIYDHAPVWAGNQKTTMERWGCLLTSLTMIGQYYGYSFSPQDLNAWLSNQPHAFTPRGALITDMFGKYLAHFKLDLPKLEYKREVFDPALLTAEIEATRPAVLKWKGSMASNHFVVARGILNDDFLIHDPATEKTLLSELGPSIVSLDTFTPSNTDLSSIVLVMDDGYHIAVTDEGGNTVPVEESIEYPLHDPAGSPPQNQGERFVRIAKPQEGTYHVAVSGPMGIYTLHTYVFNGIGDETYINFNGILNASDYFTITIGEESEIVKDTTIESVMADLDGAYRAGMIKNKAIYQLLKRELSVAQNFLTRNKTRQYQLTVEIIKKQLVAFTPRHIPQDVSAILQDGLNALLD